MAVTFAIRFDSAKNAEIAAISQMSSSLKPWLAISAKSLSEILCASALTFMAKSSMARWRGERRDRGDIPDVVVAETVARDFSEITFRNPVRFGAHFHGEVEHGALARRTPRSRRYPRCRRR